jgi:hypothetical protein
VIRHSDNLVLIMALMPAYLRLRETIADIRRSTPNCVVEPVAVDHAMPSTTEPPGESVPFESILGSIFAPPGVTTDDVSMAPLRPSVRAGSSFSFDLSITGPSFITNCAARAAARSLVHLVDAIVVFVPPSHCHAPEAPLPVTITRSPAATSVRVSVTAPAAPSSDPLASRDLGTLVIRRLAIGSCPLGTGWPVSARIFRGVEPWSRAATCEISTVAVSRDGAVYVPQSEAMPTLLVFNASGDVLQLEVPGLGDKANTAVIDDQTNTLLVVENLGHGKMSSMFAIDLYTRALRWTVPGLHYSWGAAVLSDGPYSGCTPVVVVAATALGESPHALPVFRVSDGVRVSDKVLNPRQPICLAADQARDVVYVAMNNSYVVYAFDWNGSVLSERGLVRAAGVGGKHSRHLAVMPPASVESSASYLIIGSYKTSELLVLSLPSEELVHTHRLSGISVVGLGADPYGTALIVCDSKTNRVHSLPWPLPDMPPLA